MSDFLNPVTAALELVEQYRVSVCKALVRGGLAEEQAKQVLDYVSLSAGASRQSFDPQIWFTLRREFARSDRSFAALAAELGMSEKIVDAFPRLRSPYKHQVEAIRSITAGHTTVLATGTGSGKTEAFLAPVMQLCLRHPGSGVKAILIYPRNALAEDQSRRIEDHCRVASLRVGRLIGQTDEEQRHALMYDPPDLLLTNHVMLERILTREKFSPLRGKGSLRAIVLDELHTFRGSAGADMAWLVRRLRAEAGTAPICVGASASLHSAGGYLADGRPGDKGHRLREFVEDLFGIPEGESLTVIEPTYVSEPLEGGEFPELRWDELRWTANFADAEQVAAAILGERPAELRAAITDANGNSSRRSEGLLAERLRAHAVVRAWRRLLVTRGAVTLDEFAASSNSTFQECHGRNCPDAKRFTEGLLAAVNLANRLAADQRRNEQHAPAVLSLVVHVVMRNVLGKLTTCLWCDRYHLGAESECTQCGRPLLDVWREDIHWAVGAIEERDGRRRLMPLPGTSGRSPALVVRVARRVRLKADRACIAVKLGDRATADGGLDVAADASGEHVLCGPVLYPDRNWSSLLVSAIETHHGLDYLTGATKRLLGAAGSVPRLLVFGDSRGSVATTGYVLRETHAHQFLLGIAREGDEPVTLPEALGQVRRRIAELSSSPYCSELAASVPLWFVRLCATPSRKFVEHEGLLVPISPDKASQSGEAGSFLVLACLREGCIAWNDLVAAPAAEERSLFELDHAARTTRRVLTFEAGVREHPGVQSVALTGWRNTIYELEVARFGPESLRRAADQLATEGILIKVADALEGDKPAFALSPQAVGIAPECERHQSLAQYFAAEIHSSETSAAKRSQIERDFDDPSSPLSVLVATSTLEMGVDFENLRHVLCNGMPPNPAAYAQRIGRAGRSRSAWYALGAVWCDDTRAHDMFFFHRSEEARAMLCGRVAAPRIDITNPLVVRRHFFAALVQDRVDDPCALNELIERPECTLARVPQKLLSQFAKYLSLNDEITGRFATALRDLLTLERLDSRWQSEVWFSSPLAPDYGFRRDEVQLVRLERENETQLPAGEPDGEEVSRRPPEQAATLWFPGRVVATARGLMRIDRGAGPRGEFQFCQSESGLAREIRVPQFRKLLAHREEGFVGRDDRERANRIKATLNGQPLETAGTDLRWVLWAAVPEAELKIVNFGPPPKSNDSERDTELSTAAPWGHRTVCDALVVCVDKMVVGQSGFASLASVLDHAIQQHFRLSESELLLLDQVAASFVPHGFDAIVLADAGGRGIIPVTRLANELRDSLAEAFDRLVNCDCADGCYRCLRTYGTMRFAPDASRVSAISLLKAVLGVGRWTPRLPASPFDQLPASPAVAISIRHHGAEVRWNAPGRTGRIQLQNAGGEKAAVVEAFVAATDDCPPGSCIRVDTNKPYLFDLLASKQGSPEPAVQRLLFHALKFRSVQPLRHQSNSHVTS